MEESHGWHTLPWTTTNWIPLIPLFHGGEGSKAIKKQPAMRCAAADWNLWPQKNNIYESEKKHVPCSFSSQETLEGQPNRSSIMTMRWSPPLAPQIEITSVDGKTADEACVSIRRVLHRQKEPRGQPCALYQSQSNFEWIFAHCGGFMGY